MTPEQSARIETLRYLVGESGGTRQGHRELTRRSQFLGPISQVILEEVDAERPDAHDEAMGHSVTAWNAAIRNGFICC